MPRAARILAINGSYRDDGVTDQAVDVVVAALREAGADVDTVLLRERHIEFCLNCRVCTQEPGPVPGKCVHQDEMRDIVERIEEADGLVLAAPTNFDSVTAIFKRFMERLIVYAEWPWGAPAPKFRKAHQPKKRALLISSCAAPGVIGRWFFGTHKQLRMTARVIGAKPVGTLFLGQVSQSPDQRLSGTARRRALKLAAKLV